MEEGVKINSLIVMFSFIFLKIYHGRQESWIRHGQKDYWFSSHNLDWEQAQLYCDANNSRLAIVATTGQHNFLREKILEDMDPKVLVYWIGARYDAVYGEHRWLDGTAMTVKGWGFGRPVNYTEEVTTDSTCMSSTSAYIQQHSATLLVAVCVLGGVVLLTVVVGISFICWRCKRTQNRKTNSTSKGTAAEDVDRYEHLSPTRDQNIQMYEDIHEEKDVQYTYI